MPSSTHDRLAAMLVARRNDDGGFGPQGRSPSEPEPTALVALALGDAAAASWLTTSQRVDGSWALAAGGVLNDSATPLAAIAVGPGTARDRALAYLITHQAQPVKPTPSVPLDGTKRGWGWTDATAGWVEPTARVLLALRIGRSPATAALEDAVGYLRDRECVGGGWNYGNRTVLQKDLPPYAQTTAIALIALQSLDIAADLRARGAARLAALDERGGLTLAMRWAASTLEGVAAQPEWEGELAEGYDRTGFLGDTLTLAWATLVTGPHLDALRAPA